MNFFGGRKGRCIFYNGAQGIISCLFPFTVSVRLVQRKVGWNRVIG
jgi:hypothetical protein